jgi:D-alanyl-D-alanine dipeptidase
VNHRLAALVLAIVAFGASCASRSSVSPELGEQQEAEAPLGTVERAPKRATAPSADRLFQTGETTTGEKVAWPGGTAAQITAQIVTIAPGQTTGWHRHGVPTFGYVLSGELEVEYDGIGRRVLKEGDSLMEAMKTAHNAVNLGTEPVRILAVFMGAQGKPTTMKAEPPSMPAALAAGHASDLVDLATLEPSLRIDLRYATPNNFTGEVIYSKARALMQRPAATALKRAAARARESGFGFVILDAYRPWSVTRMFWDEFPMHRAYLADPAEGSRHNRGCAVDLTLFELATGREVPMPSAYDDFSERAHPAWTGGTEAERASRDKLRAIMEAEGFTVYENEWWHFDYKGWREYPVLDVSFDSVAPS